MIKDDETNKAILGWNHCPECKGNGQVWYERNVGQTISNPEGQPHEYLDSCENCGGSGEVMMDELDWLPE